MRLVAKVNQPDSETERLMIYDAGDAVYLFGYKSLEDSAADWDEWFEDIVEAKEASELKYQVKSTDWQQIPDPLNGCQHD